MAAVGAEAAAIVVRVCFAVEGHFVVEVAEGRHHCSLGIAVTVAVERNGRSFEAQSQVRIAEVGSWVRTGAEGSREKLAEGAGTLP